MSGLISSLVNSNGALRVHSKSLEITGKNLANINNRGYSKQRVDVGDRGSIQNGIATESMGVEALELRQNRDALLDKSVMREINSSSSLEAAKKVLESAETALGQFLDRTKDSTSIQNAPGSNGGGISDALSDFFNAWESFSVKPNDVGEKQLLMAKAQILAEKINATDKRLAQVQADVDAQITTDVGVVNNLLAEIAKTNEYIAKAELVKPNSAVDLRDQRQAKLEELAKYVDVTFSPSPDGLGQIIVKSGDNVLVDGKTVTGQTIDSSGAISGPYSYDETSSDFKYNNATLSGNLPAGKISAQLSTSIDNIQSTRSQIKDLAIQLKQEVNNTYNANGGTGNFFNFSITSADLLDLQFNSSMSPTAGASGGNVRALKVAELGTKIYTPTTKSELTSASSHNLSDGESVTVGSNSYIVEKLSDTSFMLKSTDTPPVYADMTGDLNITRTNTTTLPVFGRKLDFAGSFSSNFNKTVTILAQELNTTNVRLEDQKLSENMAVANRDQFSGVSQDEEMTDMMKFQRSFQATARHISVIDELLDLVVNRLGHF